MTERSKTPSNIFILILLCVKATVETNEDALTISLTHRSQSSKKTKSTWRSNCELPSDVSCVIISTPRGSLLQPGNYIGCLFPLLAEFAITIFTLPSLLFERLLITAFSFMCMLNNIMFAQHTVQTSFESLLATHL